MFLQPQILAVVGGTMGHRGSGYTAEDLQGTDGLSQLGDAGEAHSVPFQEASPALLRAPAHLSFTFYPVLTLSFQRCFSLQSPHTGSGSCPRPSVCSSKGLRPIVPPLPPYLMTSSDLSTHLFDFNTSLNIYPIDQWPTLKVVREQLDTIHGSIWVPDNRKWSGLWQVYLQPKIDLKVLKYHEQN